MDRISRRHVVDEETSDQLDLVPMQSRVIKHVRKVYGYRGCETVSFTADEPAQLIEKSMASPSVLAKMLTTTLRSASGRSLSDSGPEAGRTGS
ncbi:putative Helix-turn-helix domain of transposase IS66 [compost metagenome]